MNTERPGTAQTVPAMVNTWMRGADMAQRTCSVADCDRPYLSRDLCRMHYLRWWRAEPRRPRPTMEQRFWSYVDKTDDCWVWIGGTTSTGYGHFITEGRHVGSLQDVAHRVSYRLARGPIPKGLEIDHLCRNRRCVNPDHLEAVTHLVNMRRGRAART